jgi:hypothetical protein
VETAIAQFLLDVTGALRSYEYSIFDSDGIVARVAVPETGSVTGTFYRDHILTTVVNQYTGMASHQITTCALPWFKLI